MTVIACRLPNPPQAHTSKENACLSLSCFGTGSSETLLSLQSPSMEYPHNLEQRVSASDAVLSDLCTEY